MWEEHSVRLPSKQSRWEDRPWYPSVLACFPFPSWKKLITPPWPSGPCPWKANTRHGWEDEGKLSHPAARSPQEAPMGFTDWDVESLSLRMVRSGSRSHSRRVWATGTMLGLRALSTEGIFSALVKVVYSQRMCPHFDLKGTL